jgi:hypothetical protein
MNDADVDMSFVRLAEFDRTEDIHRSDYEQSSDSTAAAGSKRRWLSRTAGLSFGQEEAFVNMHLRKMNRAMSGTKSREKKYEYAAVLLYLVIVLSTKNWESEPGETDETDYFVMLTFSQVVVLAAWLSVAFVVTSVLEESRFIALLYLMVVYIPLIYEVAYVVLIDAGERQIWGVAFVVTETLALALFVFIYYLFPRFINSIWFRRKGRASWYFRVDLFSDWTMAYTRRTGRCGLGSRHVCKYNGDTNEKGQPHGIGRWFDDAHEGEILTGAWERGMPVAPFSSRIYGTGDAFRAVLVPFLKASDDRFESTKLWPTNKLRVECGVASVECSVAGAFFNELPEAKLFIGPSPFDMKMSIREMYDSLLTIHQKEKTQSLSIIADNSRGIQIEGHIHAATGRAIQKVEEVLVRVKKEVTDPLSHSNLPVISSITEDRRLTFTGIEKFRAPTAQATTAQSSDSNYEHAKVLEGRTSTPPQISLEVEGWVQSEKKDVLIFFPGFNCPLKNALEGFGQLLAMTKLDSQVYPILFNWPAGQVLTYYSSSRAAHSKKNYNNFCQLLNGLRHEGFRNVHLMSHSMGAQTLLGALADKKDGSRSDSSLCFALASDYDEGKQQQDEEERGLFCKTITLLNPDFPLVPFQEHAFPAARKLCRTITVVGDKLDVALFWSQVLNGIAIRVGYEQPHALLPNDDCKNKFQHCQTVGRNVGSLYFPEDVVYRRTIGKQDNLLFKHKAPHVSLYCEEKASEKAWMDLDVVDTTDLDNNMQKIRHSAYNLNPSLFNDLEELITTGKRAMDRSLMYRDGNVFSYCSAPSFVNM